MNILFRVIDEPIPVPCIAPRTLVNYIDVNAPTWHQHQKRPVSHRPQHDRPRGLIVTCHRLVPGGSRSTVLRSGHNGGNQHRPTTPSSTSCRLQLPTHRRPAAIGTLHPHLGQGLPAKTTRHVPGRPGTRAAAASHRTPWPLQCGHAAAVSDRQGRAQLTGAAHRLHHAEPRTSRSPGPIPKAVAARANSASLRHEVPTDAAARLRAITACSSPTGPAPMTERKSRPAVPSRMQS